MFLHSKCNKPLLADLSRLASLKTGAFSISTHGARAGVMELVASSRKKFTLQFECQSCGEILEGYDDIVCTCLVCRKNHPVASLLTTDEIPVICTECFKALKAGIKEGDSQFLVMAATYLTLPSDMKFKTLQSVLSAISF